MDLSANALGHKWQGKGRSPGNENLKRFSQYKNKITTLYFTCMSPDVTLEQPRPGETFAADWTFAVLIVSPQMH